MARKKKKDSTPPPPKPESVGTSLRGLLREAKEKLQEPAPAAKAPAPRAKPVKAAKAILPASGRPSDGLRGEDRTAFHDAMAGVRPVGGAPRATPDAPRPAPARVAPVVDTAARERLASLVAGALRFDVERIDEEIRGLRAGAPAAKLRDLMSKHASTEATLDLHGMRGDAAEAEVARFVRREHRRGVRRVCIVHGKGLHSEGGLGVLKERVVHALTEGLAAPLVIAFATAPLDLGGSGALLVELAR